MLPRSDSNWWVIVRFAVAVIFLLIGLAIFAAAGPLGVPVAAAMFVIAGILVASPVAAWFGAAAGTVVMPAQALERVPPAYGAAEARLKEGRYPEAMSLFEQIAAEYPGELRPHLAMIEIALIHLEDASRAQDIYHRGLTALGENAEACRALARAYDDSLELAASRRQPPGRRAIELNDDDRSGSIP